MDASRNPFREIVGIWPTIPITILSWNLGLGPADEVIAALEHPDRVSRISLFVNKSQLGESAVGKSCAHACHVTEALVAYLRQ